MTKPGRNDPCHCGSGQKYKKCCLAKDEADARSELAAAEAERQKAAAAEAPADDDAPAAGTKTAPARRAPFAGGNWSAGKDARSAQASRSTGRTHGSGHR
jgi:hypothetical protein